ncbi:hypothetical protein SO802_031872 [Lithocarpus litseifolius]|uniref:Uncharacterized protein n=1 Tax=Lithocarpus litseifolius TaxID=425828 RepID=A0AAW2BNI5_9ROSI
MILYSLSINGWEMMIALGFMFAASVRVSNELGRGSAKAAKFSILMTRLTSFTIGTLLVTWTGVAIGAGLQSIVAYVNLTAYYLVGIPVGAVLGFVFDMEVKGVWIGMLFGTFVQTVVLIIMTYKTNWDEQVIIARNRVNRWTVKDGSEPDHTT